MGLQWINKQMVDNSIFIEIFNIPLVRDLQKLIPLSPTNFSTWRI